MSIRTKILVFTIPFFLLFGIITTVMGINSLQKQGRQSLEAISTQMREAKNEKLNAMARTSLRILRGAAGAWLTTTPVTRCCW